LPPTFSASIPQPSNVSTSCSSSRSDRDAYTSAGSPPTRPYKLAQRFDDAALPAQIDTHTVWLEANDRERRILIEDLLDAIYIHPDHLRVVACGAPPLKVELTEVGLRPKAGMGTLVSEGGLLP